MSIYILKSDIKKVIDVKIELLEKQVMLSELSWAFETLKEIKLLALLIKEKQIYHIALAKFKTIL